MSSTFYVVTIALIFASPLIVPVGVTVAHAVKEWTETLRRIRVAVKPGFAPALAGAVPAAA
jgi:membrane-anchored glycerophosphoryl diester phosphodiesterase (GDPDase)